MGELADRRVAWDACPTHAGGGRASAVVVAVATQVTLEHAVLEALPSSLRRWHSSSRDGGAPLCLRQPISGRHTGQRRPAPRACDILVTVPSHPDHEARACDVHADGGCVGCRARASGLVSVLAREELAREAVVRVLARHVLEWLSIHVVDGIVEVVAVFLFEVILQVFRIEEVSRRDIRVGDVVISVRVDVRQIVVRHGALLGHHVGERSFGVRSGTAIHQGRARSSVGRVQLARRWNRRTGTQIVLRLAVFLLAFHVFVAGIVSSFASVVHHHRKPLCDPLRVGVMDRSAATFVRASARARAHFLTRVPPQPSTGRRAALEGHAREPRQASQRRDRCPEVANARAHHRQRCEVGAASREAPLGDVREAGVAIEHESL